MSAVQPLQAGRLSHQARPQLLGRNAQNILWIRLCEAPRPAPQLPYSRESLSRKLTLQPNKAPHRAHTTVSASQQLHIMLHINLKLLWRRT